MPSVVVARTVTRVMSCEASVVAVSTGQGPSSLDGLLDRAVHRLGELERRWSRFLGHSELSILNHNAGRAITVSTDTIALVEAMVRGWHATAGHFDPSLLSTLVELGYAESRKDSRRRTSLPATTARRGSPGEIVIDHELGTVRLPHGTTLDPGGIGKGLAADIVVGELLREGAVGALVEIGGDLRASGLAATGDGWPIAVDTGLGQITVGLLDGGVATSTSRLRTWQDGGRRRHHLIDPKTLECSETDCVSCTVIAGTAAWAEVFTKVAFTLDPSAAIDALERRGLAASITTDDGERRTTTAWKDFER